MNHVSIVRYEAIAADVWNAFNQAAANGHFLFDRNFMDYHADRFTDASAMVFIGGALVGLFPANKADDRLYSHQGLTFGGLIYDAGLKAEEVVAIFAALAEYGRSLGCREIIYKAMPSIYNRAATDASLYALFVQGAATLSRDLTQTIDYRLPTQLSSRRRRAVKKSLASELVFAWDQDWEGYWSVLADVLGRRHGRTPVHTPAELRLLADRFPEAIKLYSARLDGEMVGGVVMFTSSQVAHAQYIAANPAGQSLGALDGVMDFLINFYLPTKRYFDFGISTADSGRYLNIGLAAYKQEWGAAFVAQESFLWQI